MHKVTPQATWPLLLVSIVIASCALVVTGQPTHSMTVDEPNHLLRGVRPLQTGDFSLSYSHPPLANLITALPVAFRSPRAFPTILQQPPEDQMAHQGIAGDLGIFNLADRWFWKYLDAPGVQLKKARLMNLVFLLLMVSVVAAWSHTVWGWGGAILSTALVGLTPLTIAMAYFVGNDLASAAVAIAMLFASFHYWLNPSPWRAILAGALSGAAVTTKYSLIALLPVPLLAVLCSRFVPTDGAKEGSPGGGRPRLTKGVGLRTLRDIVLAGSTGVMVVWAAYGLRDGILFVPTFRYPLLAAFSPFLPDLFLLGLDRFLHGVTAGRVTYLLGEVYRGGRWFYFPVQYAVKTPLPELLLVVPGVLLAARLCWTWRRSRLGVAALATLGLGGMLMAASLLASQVNIGFRHALPLLPILAVLAGSWAKAKSRWGWALSSALVVWLFAETAFSHPHQFTYCNQLAGGTGNCYRYVGAEDWGQDLGRVAAFQRAHQTGPMYVIRFSIASPSAFGIEAYPKASPEMFKTALAAGVLRWVAATKQAFLVPGGWGEGEAICELLRYEPVPFEGKGMWIFEVVPERLRDPVPMADIEACRERAKVIPWKLQRGSSEGE